MRQRRLILFCGLPGSGKTTISKKLCEVMGAKIIDLDDFKKTDVDPTLVKSEIDPPELRWTYYHKGLDEAVNIFTNGHQNIIIDEVFHLKELRQRIKRFCDDQNIILVWIEVQCPYEVVRDRLLSNPRVGHILSSEEALRMYKKFSGIFDPFAQLDRHITIMNTDDDKLDEIIDQILEKIQKY